MEKKGAVINIHRILSRTDDLIYRAEVIVGVSLTVVMTIVVFLQVMFRYVINDPLGWSEEFSRYVFVWTCMIGASIGIKNKAHYGLEAVFRLIPEGKRKVFEVLFYFLVGSFLVVLVYYGFNLSRDIYQQTSSGLEISMAIPYAAIPVGALLMLIHILLMPFNNEDKDESRLC